MNSKLSLFFVGLVLCASVVHECEGTYFTLGGLWLDSSIAFTIFNKFLYLIHAIGKRDVAPPVSSWSNVATPNQYLSVATSIDTDKCLPLAVCAAMAKSRNSTNQLNRFESLVVDTFTREISSGGVDRVSPMSYYVAAAKFGQAVGVVDDCRMVAPTCKYSLSDLSQIALKTSA